MREDNKSIIIITHKLNEVLSVSDRVSILRKGEYIGTLNTKDTNERELTNFMVGNTVDLKLERLRLEATAPTLEIRDLNVLKDDGTKAIEGLNFFLRGGQILGVAGIAGCGQKELCEAIVGLRNYKGEISHFGESIVGYSPEKIKEIGIRMSFIPEDRLGLGLAPNLSIVDNLLLKNYKQSKGIFVDRKSARADALEVIERYNVQTESVETPVKNLSGGNIQKILLGREIGTNPNVIITAYPVRGLDINSAYMIYDILNEEKAKNTAILFIGEDLDVLLTFCDKIMVLCEGKNMGIVHTKNTTKEEIGLMMTGAKNLLELYPEKKYGFADDSLIDKNIEKTAEGAEKDLIRKRVCSVLFDTFLSYALFLRRAAVFHKSLIFSVSYRSGVRKHVTDVGNTRQIHNNSLKAETEACVLGAAVFTEVEIPPIVLFLETKLLHTRGQHIQALLTLRAANDLADARNEKVHGRNGLSVIIHAHIECLDILGIVHKENGLLIYLFCEVSFMLGLQIDAPIYGELEALAALLENLDRLGVGHLRIVSLAQCTETLKQALIHEAIEEIQLLGTFIHNMADDILDHIPCQLHIIVQIRKGDLGLDHPELSRMTCRIRILRTEGRTEGVDITERHRVGLALELARNREVRALAEEVLGEVHLTRLGERGILHIQGGDAEHLARAFGIRGRDDGGVHIHKAAIVEEGMDRIGNLGAHAEYRGEQIRSRAKVRLLSKELHTVALGLQGVIGGRSTLNLDLIRLQLKGLLCPGRQGQNTRHNQSRADVLRRDRIVIINSVSLKHHLDALEIRAVVQINKSKSLGVTQVAHPSADGHALTAEALGTLINFS